MLQLYFVPLSLPVKEKGYPCPTQCVSCLCLSFFPISLPRRMLVGKLQLQTLDPPFELIPCAKTSGSPS